MRQPGVLQGVGPILFAAPNRRMIPGAAVKERLEPLLADGVVDEVIGRLKTGKEAEVWLVRRGEEIVAAKVYHDREHRSFRQNAVYKEGRQIRNSRTRRAIEKGSSFGKEASDDAWKFAEADALYKLHGLGVRVPQPVMFYEGVLLMEVVIMATCRRSMSCLGGTGRS